MGDETMEVLNTGGRVIESSEWLDAIPKCGSGPRRWGRAIRTSACSLPQCTTLTDTDCQRVRGVNGSFSDPRVLDALELARRTTCIWNPNPTPHLRRRCAW